jgi:hypothetical protein
LSLVKKIINRFNQKKFKVAILMMQKNEAELIDKWVDYHSYLFGAKNLYIFDNGSDDEKCIGSLNTSLDRGVNVDWSFNAKEDFEAKGDVLGNKIKELESLDKYDCFLLLDCDEFIGVYDKSNAISCEREDVFAELMAYSCDPSILMISNQFFNTPISENYFQPNKNRKCFFMKGSFKQIDVGFHWGKCRNSNQETRTKLVHFHFHYKPLVIAREHAKNKLELRIANFEKETLENYRGLGFHLTKYFLLDEAEYLHSRLNGDYVFSTILGEKFSELSISWPYAIDIESAKKTLCGNDYNEQNINELFALRCKRCRGSIDTVRVFENHIEFDGWAVSDILMPVTDFLLVFNKTTKLNVTPLRTSHRPDISKQYDMNRKFGFIFSVAIDYFEHVKSASDFEVFPITQKGIMGAAMSLNPTYHDAIANAASQA